MPASMKTCPQCKADSPLEARACRQCGFPLAATPDPGGETTCLGDDTQPPTDPDETVLYEPEGEAVRPQSFVEWQKASSGAGSSSLPSGMEIGSRYRVVRLLGQGGMGAVYRV
jgi:hypothetical protein